MSELKDQALHANGNIVAVIISENGNRLSPRNKDRLQSAKCDIYEVAEGIESLHALNAELVEALEEALSVIRSYLDYDHSGDPWEEDARVMGEMDINDYRRDGRLEKAEAALAKAKGEQQ